MLAIAPERAAAHNNRGNALFALGRLEEARAAFRRALELDPDLVAARRNLGHLDTAETALLTKPPAAPQASDATAEASPTKPSEPTSTDASTSPTLSLGVRFEQRRDTLTGRVGAAVTELDPDGLATRAGLEVGDLVLRAGGSSLSGAADLRRQLEALASGSSLRLDVLRGETALALTFTRP